jgi:hypothetical protein
MENRDFKGVWIPKEIYLNKDLSWSEKILLIEIDSLDNDEEKGCFASNKYLSEFIGISESSMANMISKLKSQNYLFQVFFDGRNRGLRLHKNMKSGFIKDVETSQEYEGRVHKNMKAELTKIVKQTTQKNEHSNIINNTTSKTSIDDRKNAFGYTLKEFESKYPVQMLEAFFRYWAEKNKSGTKMKWELEKTFEVGLRLATWASRDKTFNSQQGQIFTPAPPKKQMTNEERRRA